MNLRLGIRLGRIEPFEAEDIGEGFGAHDPRGREFPGGLRPESVPVHDKAHPAETLGGQKPIQHRDRELRFAGAGRHGEKHVPPSLRQLAPPLFRWRCF